MAEAGLPALQILPASPGPQVLQLPQQPVQPVQPPIAPDQAVSPTQLIQHMPQINGSYFKPEFAGKPEEDAGAHLHRMND